MDIDLGLLDIVLRLFGYRSGACWISFWSFLDIVLGLFGYRSGALWISIWGFWISFWGFLDIVLGRVGYRSGAFWISFWGFLDIDLGLCGSHSEINIVGLCSLRILLA